MQAYQSKPINDTYCIVQSHLLGKGSTGNVYQGYQRNNPNNRVAIKVIDLRSIDNEVTRYLLSCQIAALSNLGKLKGTGHQNIVKLHQVVLQDHFLYLVMQCLQGGTLSDYIKKHPQGMPELEAICIFRQLLDAYLHIKNKQIVHRDLKPDNVLFKSNPEISKKVAIIDFGYCQMEEVPNKPQMFYNVGSPKYMSPQAYKDNHYSQKSDIWALAVIFYEMLAGKTCDQGMNMQNYLSMIQNQGIPLPNHFSPFNRHILCLMLSNPSNNRATCQQILHEIGSYEMRLSHQKSQLILRQSYHQIKSSQNLDNVRMNKTNLIFQSLILPRNSNEGVRGSFDQGDNYVRSIKPVSRSPVISINQRPFVQIRQRYYQQNLRNAQNNFNSAPQSINRKIGPQINDQNSYQGSNRNSFINPFTHQMKINVNNQNGNFQIDQNLPVNIQRTEAQNNSPLLSIHNQQNKIQFVHHFPTQNQHQMNNLPPPPPQNQYLPNGKPIKIRINSPSTPNNGHIVNIQQEKRIEIQPTLQTRYYSPQKLTITLPQNTIQFNKQKLQTEPSPQSSKLPRQIINLRPSFGHGQVKVGFTKLQPQRLMKQNQLNQNGLVRHNFCA